MAQRISRAKQQIRRAGATFGEIEPSPVAERAERLPVVLHVLYLMFNEGYAASSGPDLQRVELTAEAIRLTRRRAPAAARRRRGRRPAGADAAHRRPTGGPHRRQRRAGPAGRAGPQPLGPGRHRRGRRPHHRHAGPGPPRPLPAAGRHRRGARRGADRGARPTGPRSSPSTTCSTGWRPTPWSRSTGPWPWPWSTGPRPGSTCSPPSTATIAWSTTIGSPSVRAHLLEMAGDRRGRPRRVPRRGPAHHEPPRAALPRGPRRPPRRPSPNW